MIPRKLVQQLVPDLVKLSDDQFAWIGQLVSALSLPVNSRRNPHSTVFPDDRSLGLFFLYLVTHHTLSAEAFKQEKFEYALERIALATGRTATRPPSRTHPGHDLTIDAERWSLKTEAHAGIKSAVIHISKWQELGKGKWGNAVADLRRLCRDHFLRHLANYDRILNLRRLTPASATKHHYEVLELPRHLLLESDVKGVYQMMKTSTQTPKPGYCRVSDASGLMFELYFDGGTERKLRVQKLRRDLCVFHAEWEFETPKP